VIFGIYFGRLLARPLNISSTLMPQLAAGVIQESLAWITRLRHTTGWRDNTVSHRTVSIGNYNTLV